MRTFSLTLCTVVLLLCASTFDAQGQDRWRQGREASPKALNTQQSEDADEPPNLWGLDVLISNDGFGLGGFYRRAFSPDLSGVIALSISESKDSREVDRYDPYYQVSYVPGKLNRFLVLPLTFSVQYRLFREDIVDSFRPYVTGGIGPVMIYQMPYVNLNTSSGYVVPEDVNFFKALGKGQPHYTGTAFVGFGANFGGVQSTIFGVNFRYYFTYLFSEGLPSLYNVNSGEVASTKKDFGGFYITLNVGFGS